MRPFLLGLALLLLAPGVASAAPLSLGGLGDAVGGALSDLGRVAGQVAGQVADQAQHAFPAGPAPAPAAPVAPPEAPPLGSQTVGADMDTRAGLGAALQRWLSDPAGSVQGWMGSLPPDVQTAVTAVAGAALSGLAVAGAYIVGFRQVDGQNLLEHDTRAKLLRLVRETPGLHLREVARRMGMTTTNASYHLRMLERHHLIRSERFNGRRVYVPAGAAQTVQRFVANALLHRDSRAEVARVVGARPGSNQLHIAHATGQHQGAVNWHLRRLMEAGLVTEERTPRECRYRLTPLGQDLVAKP